jgi:hypothetical protein
MCRATPSWNRVHWDYILYFKLFNRSTFIHFVECKFILRLSSIYRISNNWSVMLFLSPSAMPFCFPLSIQRNNWCRNSIRVGTLCQSQYKSRNCVGNIAESFQDLGYSKLVRHFFESSHGKGLFPYQYPLWIQCLDSMNRPDSSDWLKWFAIAFNFLYVFKNSSCWYSDETVLRISHSPDNDHETDHDDIVVEQTESVADLISKGTIFAILCNDDQL